MSEFIKNNFLDIEEGTRLAIAKRRQVDPNRVCKFYIPFLDQQTKGIVPSELIVIGADTGIGKTHLANMIAYKNAEAGKKVYLFSLEGTKEEVYHRWLWNIICREYYKNPNGKVMNYADYVMNKLELYDIEKIAYEEISELKENLFIYDRHQNLNIDTFCYEFERIYDADLVIIDHLHYFDILNPRDELHEIYQIMKETKTMVEEKGIPVILISHLRKKAKERGIPGNEEFMGSSNIPKIASTCITLASDPENHLLNEGMYSTFFTVTKSRIGANLYLTARIMFDSHHKTYESRFELGSNTLGIYKQLDYNKYPKWAQEIKF